MTARTTVQIAIPSPGLEAALPVPRKIASAKGSNTVQMAAAMKAPPQIAPQSTRRCVALIGSVDCVYVDVSVMTHTPFPTLLSWLERCMYIVLRCIFSGCNGKDCGASCSPESHWGRESRRFYWTAAWVTLTMINATQATAAKLARILSRGMISFCTYFECARPRRLQGICHGIVKVWELAIG